MIVLFLGLHDHLEQVEILSCIRSTSLWRGTGRNTPMKVQELERVWILIPRRTVSIPLL